MSKRRCSQCDKELPASWSERSSDATWDPVCPECASRDLKKKSLRRRRILDTSVRKKPNLDLLPQPATPAQPPAQPIAQAPAQSNSQAPAQPQTPIPTSSNVSQRQPIPVDIELDTDDPLLLAAQEAAAGEETKEVDPLEETTQMKIRKPKLPPGPQVRLNF
jgi:hypothetical protein